MNKIFLLSAVAVFSAVSNQSFGQSIPMCLSSDSDADGDGYGWENNQSCIVVEQSANQPSDTFSQCEDFGDFPWGWNTTTRSSCRLDAQSGVSTVPGTVIDAASNSCVDTDGDGWGWDGTNSCRVGEAVDGQSTSGVVTDNNASDIGPCIDTDGDGFGWNGIASCLVSSETIEETAPTVSLPGQDSVIERYLGRYETTTEALWGANDASGPVSSLITNGWIDGEPDAPLGFPQGYFSSLVGCEDPDIAIEDPSNPGLFFDAARGRTCSKSRFLAIPAPQPVEFTNIGAEVLYENGNQWSCFEETRPTMSTEFERNGRVGGISFNMSDGTTVRIGNAVYSSSLGVRGHYLSLSEFRGRTVFSTAVSYTDGTLKLYRSGLTRLQCARIPEKNYPFSAYLGEDKAELYQGAWNAFIGDSTPNAMIATIGATDYPATDFERLSGDQLAGSTMQCGEIYGRGTLGTRIDTNLELDTVTAAGGSELNFSGGVWTEAPDHVFSRSTGSGGFNTVFYKYTDDLSLRYTFWSGAIGSSSGFKKSVSVCETIASE